VIHFINNRHTIFVWNILQFFWMVYTHFLVLETQWPQHSFPNPLNQFCWTTSTIQIAVLKHTFFKTLHTILCIWHNFHAENLLFSWVHSCFHVFTAIQIFTLTRHMGKHISHSFTISNQSFSIKYHNQREDAA